MRSVLEHIQGITGASSLATSLASLLAVIALILVFFIGIVIDLLGFLAPSLEVVAFRRRLARHDLWLKPNLAKYSDLLGPDIRKLDEYHPAASGVATLKEAFTTIPFSKKYRRLAARNWRFLFVISSYQRIFSLLITLALRRASPSSGEILRDQLSLWRTSRAIATTIFILVLEVPLHVLGRKT